MFTTRWRTRFEPGALTLVDYPFPRGERPSRLASKEIGEVCVGWFPPTVRTREGEYLFIPAEQARELADFASQHGIPFVRRNDLWSFILEEFLDTEFPPGSQEATLRYLERNGVSRAETRAMRRLVGKRMLVIRALLRRVDAARGAWEHAAGDRGGVPEVLSQPPGVRLW
jgi:hypothetical protein